MNETVDVEIFKRRLSVEMEGFTPMEILELANQVGEKMTFVSSQNKMIADTSKIATLAALHFAADLWRLKDKTDTEIRTLESKIEELSAVLQTALAAAKPK